MPVGLVVVITSIHEPVFRIRKQGLCCSLLLGMPHVIERGTLNGLWIDRFLLSHQFGTWGHLFSCRPWMGTYPFGYVVTGDISLGYRVTFY